MSGYDGREFLARVRAHQLHVRGRTVPTGCWVCDMPEVFMSSTLHLAATDVEIGSLTRVYRERCRIVSGGIVDAHHCLPKRVIRTEGHAHPEVVLADVLMDPRNGILVRRFHHDALERRALAIPVALLPRDVLEFADELGLRWWLDNQESRRA